MKGIDLVKIITIFSVVIPIQSHETFTIDVYNYESFGELFPQSRGIDDFHVYEYANMDNIFAEKYKGSNIGGAFLVQGDNITYAPKSEGYLVDITATFYCGSTHAEDGENSLSMDVWYDGDRDFTYICQERGWHYNYTWIPPSGAKHHSFTVNINAHRANINKPYGFDELRITSTNTQHLQPDNPSHNPATTPEQH